MSRIIFCDDERAAGFFVEAVHDSRALFSADAGKVFAVREERVHERVLLMTGAGMNDEARGLVDDKEIVVLEKNVEVHRFRFRVDLRNFRFAPLDGIATADDIARPRRLAVHLHEPIANERLQSRT